MKKIALFRGALALVVAASLVACSGGAELLVPRASNGSDSGTKNRRPMYLNLGDTQPVLTGSALIPLSLSVTGGVGTLSVFGSTYCTAASGLNPCPNINFMASPPTWQNATAIGFAMGSTVLNAACNAPAAPPTPAPGFTPGCYIGAYEGGSGPYLIQGPVSGSAGSLSVLGNTSTLNFNPGEAYNFFLMYVTAISSPPPPPSPTPVPSPTEFATQPPPATPSPTAQPSFTPGPCPSSTSGDDDGEHDDVYGARTMHERHRPGDGDDDGACSSPSPKPTPTCAGDDDGGRHHRHHSDGVRTTRGHSRGHDDDCGDD